MKEEQHYYTYNKQHKQHQPTNNEQMQIGGEEEPFTQATAATQTSSCESIPPSDISSSTSLPLSPDTFTGSPASATTTITTASLSSSSSSVSGSLSADTDSHSQTHDHQGIDSDSSGSSSDDDSNRTHRMRVEQEKHAQATHRTSAETGSGRGTMTASNTHGMKRSNSSTFVCSSSSPIISSQYHRPPQLSSAPNTPPAAVRPHIGRTSRPPLWSCFLGCGKRYKKSSGRSIRRHVLSCYRDHHEAECTGITDEQLNVVIAVKQEQDGLQTGLRTWRVRQQRRSAASLPSKERWQCSNRECSQCYRSTSVKSIAKHQLTCIDNPKNIINIQNINISLSTPAPMEGPVNNGNSYQSNNSLQAQQPATPYPSPHLQITAQTLQQHALAMMAMSPLPAPLPAELPSAQYSLNPASLSFFTGSYPHLVRHSHSQAGAGGQLLSVNTQAAFNPTALPLISQSLASLGALSGYPPNIQHYLQRAAAQQHFTLSSPGSYLPPFLSPYPPPTALPVSPQLQQQQVHTHPNILSTSTSAFKKPTLTINKSPAHTPNLIAGNEGSHNQNNISAS